MRELTNVSKMAIQINSIRENAKEAAIQIRDAKYDAINKELDMVDKVAETYSWLMKSDNVVRQRIMLLDTRSSLILGRIHNFYFK